MSRFTGPFLPALVGATALICAQPAPARAQSAATASNAAAPLVTVSVHPSQLGATIPRDFAGFSLEVSTGGQGIGVYKGGQTSAQSEREQYALGHPGAPNHGFFQLMRDLGPGVLRLGGNSQDNSCWDPKQAPRPQLCQATITAGDLKLWSRAAGAAGWRLIVGLNLKQNSPSWMMREMKQGVVPDIPAHQVLALEIGNEPDLFGRGGVGRPRDYSPAQHVHDYLGYLRALRADPATRGYAVAGPATCCAWRNTRDLSAFMDGAGPARLRRNGGLVTVHNYSRTTCGNRTVTIAELLDPDRRDEFDARARDWVAAAHERQLPIAMAETNSASCGGMPGVSDSMASAVWGLDYMFSLAQDGFSEVNFHFSYRPGGGSAYNPVRTYGRALPDGGWSYDNIAQPLYYAMYVFARDAAGERLVRATAEAGAAASGGTVGSHGGSQGGPNIHPNIRAFAVSRCARCAVNVFVINEDLSAAGPVVVNMGEKRGGAKLLLLRAPSLSAGAQQVRLGGARFDSAGRLAVPEETSARPDAAGAYRFELPNAAIAVLRIPAR